MELASNANKLHKTYSVILSVILTLVSFAEFAGKDVLHLVNGFLPENAFPLVSGIIGLLIIIGRYIKQSSVSKEVTTQVEEV